MGHPLAFVTREQFIKVLIGKGMPEVYAWMVPDHLIPDTSLISKIARLSLLKNYSLGFLLIEGFRWKDTAQGYRFWDAIYNEVIIKSIELIDKEKAEASDLMWEEVMTEFCEKTCLVVDQTTLKSALQDAFKAISNH